MRWQGCENRRVRTGVRWQEGEERCEVAGVRRGVRWQEGEDRCEVAGHSASAVTQ